MSLITCPECSTFVSEKAFACPNCGHPMNRMPLVDDGGGAFKRNPHPHQAEQSLHVAPEKLRALLQALKPVQQAPRFHGIGGMGAYCGKVLPVCTHAGTTYVLVPRVMVLCCLRLYVSNWYVMSGDGQVYGQVPGRTVARLFDKAQLQRAKGSVNWGSLVGWLAFLGLLYARAHRLG